jgi:hypothetical protein
MTEAQSKRPGRNEPCHCGSGKKYKHCCLQKDEEAAWAAQAAREQEASAAQPAAPAEDQPSTRTPPPPRAAGQPWKRAVQRTRGAQRINTPRKAG